MPSRPPSTINNEAPVSSMQVGYDVSAEHKVKSQDPSTGPAAFGLSFGRVVRVDYAQHQIALQIINGEKDIFEWAPIPATYAAAGARHFIGAMPEPGDVCVVGWLATKDKTPVILAWVPVGAIAGIEWLPLQSFLPSEADLNPKNLSHFEGIYGRTRHKIRPMRPGMVVMSSSQGADVVLDEGVLLTNRRANEIRIRDQDQAIIFRSLQQFHAMGGARVYAGMVQRDGTYLPRRMFSDGTDWAAGIQEDSAGNPLPRSALGSSPTPANSLTPHGVFARSDTSLPFPDSGIYVQDNVDPYAFLARGLFIGSDGYALDPSKMVSDAEYGGKPVFRVSIDPSPENSALPFNGVIAEEATESDTLTEYRIELNHTWDGRLPVTEQTDGFDADRLPSDSVQDSAVTSAGPYLQWVLGSVVGNDPYTTRGRALYGLPLAPRIFDGTRVDPRLESAIGAPIGEHAASLFQVDSPVDDPSRVPPMFVSATKDGRIKGFISGPQNENSIELALNGGMRIDANGPIELTSPNTILNFRNGDATDNWALALKSDTGAILIRANGPTTRGSFSARTGTDALQESTLPAVAVESPNGNVHISAGRITKISAANAVQITDTNELLVAAKQSVNNLTDKWLLQCNTVDKTVQGRETNLYAGPKNFLPSNAPFRETKFVGTPLTGHAGGKTDEYSMLFGDREETFVVGNHRTTVQVGNITYQAGIGTFTAQAGTNQVVVDTSSGVSIQAPTGNVLVQTTLSVNVSALASLTLRSNGLTRLSGSVTTLGGNGNVGRIVSSSDLDPLTNLPLSTFGMGSFGHRLGPAI
jgi:hypothetical protein